MDRECNVYHSNCCHTHQPQACGSFSSAPTIQFEMIVAKNQGRCSPVCTYTNQRLLSITFHALYPPTCQVLKFTTCVFFSGAAPSEQRAVMRRGRALAEKQAADAARRGNAATRRRKALSVEVEGARRERIYFTSSSNPPLPLFISRQLKRPFQFFFYVDSAPFPSFLFSAHTILFACLCFRLFLFL